MLCTEIQHLLMQKKKHGQTTQQTRLFARSVSISSSSRLARLLEPIINVKSTTASAKGTGVQKAAHQSVLPPPLPSDRLVFRSSAFLSITTTNISVTTSSSPSLPPPPTPVSPYHSSPSFLLPLLARPLQNQIHCLPAAHTRRPRLNSPSSAPSPPHRTHASTSSPVSLSSLATDSTLVFIETHVFDLATPLPPPHAPAP
jgi:hypothetical protein